MNTVTLQQAFDVALGHHRAGRFAEAEGLYRDILAADPGQPDALHYLGLLARQAGNLEVAAELIGRALAARPGFAAAEGNMGMVLAELGRLKEAEEAYRRALALQPDFPEALNNLGNALAGQGRHEEAVGAFERALALRGDYAEAQNHLGMALRALGRLEEALKACRRALELRPQFAEALGSLGDVLWDVGRYEEALEALRKSAALRPTSAAARYQLGNALRELGRLQEAEDAYRRACVLRADFPQAHNNLGIVLSEQGRFEEALRHHERAVAIQPESAPNHNNRAGAFKEQGRMEEALAGYRRALEMDPAYVNAHSNLIFALHYHAGADGEAIAAELAEWERRHALPLEGLQRPQANSSEPERRLRVGYVSADFREHPVGHFLLPLLEGHDRAAVEVFGYSSGVIKDRWTERLRGACEQWRCLAGLSDEAAAERIRGDGIDVLVDLSLHTGGNRLLVFARKPAPVQVSYLGYAGSTGMRAVDCRLSDRFLDPEPEGNGLWREETVRLSGSYWCYRPWVELGVAPLPALKSGVVTFGSLNSFSKVNAEVLGLWARVLLAVPGSRLLLHAPEGRAREWVLGELGKAGVEAGRVGFVGRGNAAEYFGRYGGVDIALDPFPFGGGTTSCDALWMGVPVVSMKGSLAVGRAGWSILSNAGHPEWVAGSEGEYVEKAAALAGDLERLGRIRAGLREELRGSALMDEEGYVRAVEEAYRTMWRRWCSGGLGGGLGARSIESHESQGGIAP